MSNIISLAGLSNCGKSTSLKYLNPEDTFIISCTNKQLQIPGFRKKYPKAQLIDAEEKNKKIKKLIGNWLVSSNYDNIEKIMKVIFDFRV